MTLATTSPTPVLQETNDQNPGFDPEQYTMSIGEHLEELRYRLILALLGLAVSAFTCMCLKDTMMRVFLRPLMISMAHDKLPPQVSFAEMSEAFTVYIRVSLICGFAFASPWIVYQFWKFVAAGLYPRERKYVTKYVPLSITLLLSGMLFVYLIVLPLMFEFFLSFNFGPAFTVGTAHKDMAALHQPATVVPFLNGDPPSPVAGQIWLDQTQQRLKIFYDGEVRVIPFGLEGVANPVIMLSQYIDLVVQLLLSFGIAFQLPLVVLALVRIGIFEVAQLKAIRRIVYFVITVSSAFIVPDVVTGMVALMLPLVFLFELGLWMASRTPAPEPADDVLD